jgi:hypothetical protein
VGVSWGYVLSEEGKGEGSMYPRIGLVIYSLDLVFLSSQEVLPRYC